MTIRDFFRTLLGIRYLEERIIMSLETSTARIEASLATLGTDLTSQLAAVSLEIQQLATAVSSGGDTADIETRLNAAADKIDTLAQQVTDATTQLGADDPAAPADGGDTGNDPSQQTT